MLLTYKGRDTISIRADRSGSQRGGGTAIYFSTKLMGHQRLDLSLNELEAVGWNFDFQATVKL